VAVLAVALLDAFEAGVDELARREITLSK